MQFHYVVGYDSEKDRWWVEADSDAYFPDGHVWDDVAGSENGYGWIVPEDDSLADVVDKELWRTLSYLVDTFPKPEEIANG
jgi:hypothetical protein